MQKPSADQKKTEICLQREASYQATADISSMSRGTKAPMACSPINAKVYQGVVTWFRGSYGWLDCEAVAADYPHCHVMIHKNDCRDFKPKFGDRVFFRLALNGQ